MHLIWTWLLFFSCVMFCPLESDGCNNINLKIYLLKSIEGRKLILNIIISIVISLFYHSVLSKEPSHNISARQTREDARRRNTSPKYYSFARRRECEVTIRIISSSLVK